MAVGPYSVCRDPNSPPCSLRPVGKTLRASLAPGYASAQSKRGWRCRTRCPAQTQCRRRALGAVDNRRVHAMSCGSDARTGKIPASRYSEPAGSITTSQKMDAMGEVHQRRALKTGIATMSLDRGLRNRLYPTEFSAELELATTLVDGSQDHDFSRATSRFRELDLSQLMTTTVRDGGSRDRNKTESSRSRKCADFALDLPVRDRGSVAPCSIAHDRPLLSGAAENSACVSSLTACGLLLYFASEPCLPLMAASYFGLLALGAIGQSTHSSFGLASRLGTHLDLTVRRESVASAEVRCARRHRSSPGVGVGLSTRNR